MNQNSAIVARFQARRRNNEAPKPLVCMTSRSKQYREKAADYLRIARGTHDATTRAGLLEVAAAWIDLANEVEQLHRERSERPQSDLSAARVL